MADTHAPEAITTDGATMLAGIRVRLAEARADLRLAQDDYHAARLRAEIALVNDAGGETKVLGSNAEDRKRAFDARVEGDEDCQLARTALRSFEAHVARLEAELDGLIDGRREREYGVRVRLVAVMEGALAAGADPTTMGIQEALPL